MGRDQSGDAPYYSRGDLDDPEKVARLVAYVEESESVMPLIREAAERPRCWGEWRWDRTKPATTRDDLHEATRYVTSTAAVSVLRGDADEAFDRIRLAYVLQRHRLDTVPSGSSERYLFEQTAEAVGRLSVPAAQARALAHELASVDICAELPEFVRFYRVVGTHTFRALRSGDFEASYGDMGSYSTTYRRRLWVHIHLTPWLNRHGELWLLDRLDEYETLAGSPTREWPAGAREISPPTHWTMIAQRLWYGVGFRQGVRCCETAMAQRSLLSTALGLEVYRQRHGGHPAALADLESIDWPLMIEDIFSGEELVYRREGDTYVLYSIGPDFIDDKGAPCDPNRLVLGRATGGDIVWGG